MSARMQRINPNYCSFQTKQVTNTY
uniref:Uncharacterized protein n=1 Tax=Arundo donax TaxID=35708 RepID=A0A0A9C3D3_ARUDO